MGNEQTLSRVLLETMERDGLSQRELGEAIGVSQSRISRWINGSEGPQMERIPAIAEVVGLDEQQVAGLVWQAKRQPRTGPRTYAQRMISLEAQVQALTEQVQALTGTVEGIARSRRR